MRTIIIPLAGNSSRFFDSGYTNVKYKLPLFNSKPILWHILSHINREFKIVIVLNIKFDDKSWLKSLLSTLGFRHFEIVEVSDTNGQLTTVKFGIINSKIIEKSDELIIYNGDTVRHIPFDFNFNESDGMIEVFNQDGDHWSFTDKIGEVSLVSEKRRISNYCSTGLYGFKSINLFLKFSDKVKLMNKEKFIAPLYNELIREDLKVTSFLSHWSNFTLCGTPDEYELNKKLCK
jgi:dTDP-glucose pyrophosphorylase